MLSSTSHLKHVLGEVYSGHCSTDISMRYILNSPETVAGIYEKKDHSNPGGQKMFSEKKCNNRYRRVSISLPLSTIVIIIVISIVFVTGMVIVAIIGSI